MKRYLMFSGGDYYPEGGWSDFQGSFDTANEAWDAFTKQQDARHVLVRHDWMHIVDADTSDVIDKL